MLHEIQINFIPVSNRICLNEKTKTEQFLQLKQEEKKMYNERNRESKL